MDTHLCGNYYNKNADGRCPDLVYANKDGLTHGRKPLKKYSVYCTAEGRCRCLGNIASFTGNSPTWCPKRKETL
ncbi:MAG: hypothetical protein IKO68_12310 [Oscillospiraceae bacterium]|nr:hypothetical protein [Oscillospiraceae bacterium]